MDPISVEDIFGIDEKEAVDYEITFAAFLSALLFASPDIGGPLYPFAIASAILLLFLTLIRRMASINSYSRDLITQTTPALVVFTGLGMMYLSFVLTDILLSSLSISIHPSSLALVTLLGLSLFTLFFYELLFRDLFLRLSVFPFNEHVDHRGTVVGQLGLWMAHQSLEGSTLPQEKEPEEIQRIREAEPKSPSEVDYSTRLTSKIGAAIGLALIGFIVSIPFLVVHLIFSASATMILGVGVFLAISTNVLIVLLRFFYGRFGLTTFKKAAHPKLYIYYSIILYVLYFAQYAQEHGLSVL